MDIKKAYNQFSGFILIFIVYTLIKHFSFNAFGWDIIDLSIPSATIFGLIFGPFGAITVAFAYVLYDVVFFGSGFMETIPEFILIFLFAVFGYKLWYGIMLKKDSKNLLNLDSMANLNKFILIGVIVSLILSVYYNQGMDMGSVDSTTLMWNVIDFLNCFTFTIVMGMGMILLFKYMDIPFYYPGRFKFKYFNFKSIGNNRIFDYILIVTIPLMILLCIFTDFVYIPGIILAVSLFIYALKPLKPIKMDQKDFKFSKDLISINLRPQSLFENLVFIGVLLLILIFIAIFTLTQYDILINIFGLNNKMSAIVYMGVTVILLLIPFSIILNFFEKKFTRPLEVMSNKLTDYIKNGEITVDTHDSDRYSKYLSQNSEIGTLSRAILKMFSDIENYINNITSLMREKEKIEAELTVAHDIQNSFLPTDFDVGGDDVDISGIMLPAKSVGGDLYDFFMVDDDNLAFIIGDVSDKGVPAALFMSKSIQLFESYLSTRNQNFDELIYMINNALCKNNDACMFLTAWVGILNLKTGNLNYINAGHEYPIVKHCGEYEFLESENDLALGLMEDEVYTTESIDLVKGDKILLFTDGVTDANNEDNEFFGKNRLIDLASEDKSVKGIKKAVFEFIGDAEQYDDFTLLLVQFN